MTGNVIKVATSDRVFTRNVGGNTTYAKALYGHLAPFGVDHCLIGARGLAGQLPSRLRKAYYGAWEALRLPALARKAGADLLHYTSDTGALIRDREVPIVSTIGGVASRHVPGVRGPVQERSWRLRVGRLAQVSTAVFTFSHSSVRDIVEVFRVPEDRVHVTWLGIDHDRFHPGAAETEAGRRALEPLSLPERYVLFLGNLDPRKNVRALLAACQTSEVRSSGVRLVVAGAPAWRDREVVDAMKELDNVDYLGQVDAAAVAPLLDAADLFCFPSLYEGFGLPPVEAMACGTPVITSHRGSLAEVVEDAALLVDPLDTDSISRAILQLISDEAARKELASAGLERARNFTWEATAASTAETLRKVVAHGA